MLSFFRKRWYNKRTDYTTICERHGNRYHADEKNISQNASFLFFDSLSCGSFVYGA